MAPTHKPAPDVLRPKKDMVGTTLPPGASALLDSLVGTFLGSTRSEVLRFIVVSWITSNYAFVRDIGKSRTEPHE